MKPIAAIARFTTPLAILACAMLAPSARAEAEYEYAKHLMTEVGSTSFSTDDLVERLAARLDESPAATTKMEAKLIRAQLLRRQAADSPPEKKVDKLKQASDLYKELVATGEKKFRLFDMVEKDSEAVQMEINKSKLEMAKDNPAEAKKLRAEIGAVFAKKAAGYKATAEETFPGFETALKKFQAEKQRLDPNGEHPEKMPGKEFFEPLDKLFFAWVVADQKYVATKVEEIEVLDEADANRKKTAEEIVVHCQKRIDYEVLADWPAINARYSYLQGRVHAAMGNEDAASKSWNDVLEIELPQLADYPRRQVILLDKLIIADLVRLKMKSKKYSEVEDVVIKIRTGFLRTIFEEDIGKQLIVEYARALTLPAETAGEYEKAVKELRTMIDKEKQKTSMWANTFARTMAEILIDARKKKIYPHLAAREWFDAAHGMHLMGRYIYTQEYERFAKSTDPKDKEKAKEKFEEAYKEFANAVDYYRRAVTEARKADLATRLEVEPKAWFEMGLSYMRMKHDYEAIIAYKAMRDTFLPDSRAKWLPDRKANAKLYTKQVNDALAALDLPKEKEGMVAKAGVNILIALDNNEKVHTDPWNRPLKAKIVTQSNQQSPLDPDNITDLDYLAADGDSKVARSFADAAKKETNAKVAFENWSQAKAKYISAAEKFAKVSAASKVYDFALVQYANCMTQAQAIISEGRLPTEDPKLRETLMAESKDLAQKALAGYDKFEKYVADNPTQDEKILNRRKAVKGLILLAKNSLYIGAGEWEKAVATSDEYIAYETENQQTKSSAPIAYINKFRALLALAAGAKEDDAKRDDILKKASVTLAEVRKASDKKDQKTNAYMLKMLSDRYNIATYHLERKRKALPSSSKEEIEKLEDQISDYENKVAELEGERIDLIEESAALDLGLEDYSRLVYLFNKAGQYRRAADTAVKLLKKFDPQNKNLRIPENEAKWKQLTAEMLPTISYASIAKNDRAIAEHSALVDFMFDTDRGAQLPDGDTKRAPNDKYNQNMEKALAKIEAIRNKDSEFKDAATLRVGPKQDSETFKMLTESGVEPAGKSWLQILEEEVQYRRKVVAARDILAELALGVAKKLTTDGSAGDANEYMKVAKEQINILKEMKGEDAAIEVKLAQIDIALGKNEEAMIRLMNLTPGLPPESERYFQVKRLISEMFAEQKKWREAAEYPEFVAVTQGFNSEIVKRRWPEMRAFLKTCYDNGAPVHPALKKRLEAEKAGAAAPDAAKTDAAKPDAPKTDAAKPDETKPDAPKADAEKK